MSTSKIVTRIQALWEDQQETWCDKDYIQTFLALHNEDVESYLQSLDLSYDTAEIVLTGITAGMSDLSTFQADGGLLATMMIPNKLYWRLPGDDATQWRYIDYVDEVIGEKTPSMVVGVASWSWIGGLVNISPSSVDVELKMRCEILPAVLDSDSATYIKGMTNVLAYGVAAIIAFVRGGPGSKIGMWFQAKADDALDKISDRLVKNEQVVTRRMGSRRSPGRTRGHIPFGLR